MDIGVTVGDAVSALGDAGTFDFAELAIGEGDRPLPDVEPERLARHKPDDVDLTVHLPLRQPLATGIPEFDEAVRAYLDRALETAAACGADAAICLHVHDVRARGDSHIPVGAGEIDFECLAGLLAGSGFDGRVAVEVFTDDLDILRDSAGRIEGAFDRG
ncbi:MAG: hypothetical protein ABEJ27_00830 [Halodesulfurarchaeum sp.]